jgi:hypothetical protein
VKNINKMLNNMKKELTQLQEERSVFDKYIEDFKKRSARSKELSKPENYNTIKAKWRIDYIDYGCKFTEVVKDHITGDNFSDLASTSYESSQFIGTKKQFDDMMKPFALLPHNEIKIIGTSFIEEVDVDHDQVYQDYINSKK